MGELVEVTLALPPLPAGPVIPNAAIQRREGRTGVWQVADGDMRFAPVRLGTGDLAGQVLVAEGLGAGDRVVAYSSKALARRSRTAENPAFNRPGTPRCADGGACRANQQPLRQRGAGAGGVRTRSR